MKSFCVEPQRNWTWLTATILVSFVALIGPISESAFAATGNKAALRVSLTSEEAANLGIATASAHAVTYTPELSGYGVVIGLDAISQSDAEVATAEAGAKQSAAAVKRARELAAGDEAAVSQDALDLAERQAKADAATVALAHGKAAATFGRDAPWRDPSQHDAIIHSLEEGHAALVRVTFPLGDLGEIVSTTLRVSRLARESTASSWTAKKIWIAPADASVPGRSYFALVDGGLVAGEHVLVALTIGEQQKGILIPADAVILSDNATWFYFFGSNGNYARHQIDPSLAMPGGYFLHEDVAPGAQIVVKGAGLLLARELNPSTASQD